MVAMVADITDRKTYERSILRREESARQVSRFKTQFLARMSHDIRTPLNSIIGSMDVLGEMKLPKEAKAHLRTIGAAGEILLELIDDVFRYCRNRVGRTCFGGTSFRHGRTGIPGRRGGSRDRQAQGASKFSSSTRRICSTW